METIFYKTGLIVSIAIIFVLLYIVYLYSRRTQQLEYENSIAYKVVNSKTNDNFKLFEDKYKINEFKASIEIAEQEFRHISERTVRNSLGEQLSKYLLEEQILKIEEDYSHKNKTKKIFETRLFIAMEVDKLNS